jgi:hypothetical protein
MFNYQVQKELKLGNIEGINPLLYASLQRLLIILIIVILTLAAVKIRI